MASPIEEIPRYYKTQDLPEIFGDVTPIPQDDGPKPVCQIAYTPEFTMAYDYLRAIMHSQETTERVLPLTALCLQLNPANYTVWHYRRTCLFRALQSQDNAAAAAPARRHGLLERDLALAAELGGDNPKNYQIWYHRRALLEYCAVQQTNDIDTRYFLHDLVPKELAYIAVVLAEDGKNYHAWSHRQWVLMQQQQLAISNNDYQDKEESIWKQERDYVHELIQVDPRNNSAWNQRWFLSHCGRKKPLLSLSEARVEADYALWGGSLDPYNECPWRYLIAIIQEQRRQQANDADVAFRTLLNEYLPKTRQIETVLTEGGREGAACCNWVSACIDLLELQYSIAKKPSLLQEAISLAESLANKHDPIRKKYWLWRVSEMKGSLGLKVAS